MEGKRKFERFAIKTETPEKTKAAIKYLYSLGLVYYSLEYREDYLSSTYIFSNTFGKITYINSGRPDRRDPIRNIPNTEFLNNFK